MGIMGSCGRIYLEQALLLIAGSYPNLTVRVHGYHVLLDVREDVLLTFSSLQALMNHSHLPLVHVNQQHLLWDNVFKNKGIFFKGNLKYGVVSHLLPHFSTEEVGHYRAHIILIKLLIIQIDQCPITFYSSLFQLTMVLVFLASENVCRW